jgi:hypothetical protein
MAQQGKFIITLLRHGQIEPMFGEYLFRQQTREQFQNKAYMYVTYEMKKIKPFTSPPLAWFIFTNRF